jgi:type I restriction enzyme M protein
MGSYIDIKKLTIDELAGVVNLYPWFGGARKELCSRMSQMGDSWGKEQYAEAAMYVGSRGKLAAMMRSANPEKWTDADVEELIKAYAWADTIESASKAVKAKEAELSKAVRAKYAQLTDEEIKDLLINKKWLATIKNGITALYVAASHILAGRVTELGERYESTLSELTAATEDYESKVKAHLERMGFVW